MNSNEQQFMVRGTLRLPTDDQDNVARRNSGAALSLISGKVAVSGNTMRLITDYCRDPDCPDYNRNDFPQDAPHWHLGGRVSALLETVWAEIKTAQPTL